MAEVVTESFCERCGTRYTFEATAPHRRGTGRIRTLTRGVRNFVANDDASFAEAMAAAREDDTRSASSQQLDAFHLTFNFCMTCRQYTCGNCWNSGVGECLSCAPDLSLEVLPAAFPDLAVVPPDTQASTFPEPAHPNVAASAWPTSDRRPVPEAARIGAAGLPAAEPIDETEDDAAAPETAIELSPLELSAIQSALTRHVGRPDHGPAAPAKRDEPAGLEAAVIPHAAVEAGPIVAQPGGTPEPVAGARTETRRLLQRFRPRRERATPVATSTASTGPAVAAVAVEPAVAAVAVEPAVAVDELAGADPEPPPVAPEPGTAEAPPEPPPAAAPAFQRPDVAVQPTWRMVAPDGAPPGEPQSAPPAWATPGSVTRRESDAIPSASWAARVATARPFESPVWAASSRDVLGAEAPGAAGPVGIQSCVSCGLSLSANARFCRRCGTRQG
jgi:ribosomal protein L40E